MQHVIFDAVPDLVLAALHAMLPEALRAIPRLSVDLQAQGTAIPPEPNPESPALIVYTSGTTGPPKGVVLPRRAIAADIDALAEAWAWTARDVLVHALPLSHVHGLVLGVLGPLRLRTVTCGFGRSPAASDGHLRLVGRRSTDLISSDGYQIGAAEIEDTPREHPGVADAAVTGEPDPDLGEQLVAWVVAAGDPPPASEELVEHVAGLLAPHKRPRVVHFLAGLPRNDIGKVRKAELRSSR